MKTVDEVPQKFMSIFLPSLVEVAGDGSKVLYDGDWLHLATVRVKHSSAVMFELTHGTEPLSVT